MHKRRLMLGDMNLGGRLRIARERRGLTQEQLAAKVDTHQANISALESRDSKKAELLFELAEALQVNPRWLLTGIGDSWLDRQQAPRGLTPADEFWERYQRANKATRQAIDILLSEENLQEKPEADSAAAGLQ